MTQDFQFTDLSDNFKVFDGMASGDFTDFRGQNVHIDPRSLIEIVQKTKLAIQSTRTESGEIVGFPIDEDGHDHKGGAGWIVDVELDQSGTKIIFTPKWTQIGIDLIKKNIRRFFSVSVDLVNKVIMGGSLTNWPATRDAKSGQIMLRPIELSMNLYAIKENAMAEFEGMTREKMCAAIKKHKADNPDDDSISEEDVDALDEMSDAGVTKLFKVVSGKSKKKSEMSVSGMRAGLSKIASTITDFVSSLRSDPKVAEEELDDEEDTELDEEDSDDEEGENEMVKHDFTASPTMTELLRTPEAVLELGKMAELKAQEFLAVERSKVDVVEFASTLVGGTKDKPYGLPIPASEVVEVLLSLPDGQREAVKRLLTKTLNAVNFAEKGYDGEFLFGRPRLPVEYRQSLQMWLDAGKTADSFFKENVELGKATDFNLSEFQAAKVGV